MFHNTIIKNVIKNNSKRFLSVKVMGDESAFNNVHKVIKTILIIMIVHVNDNYYKAVGNTDLYKGNENTGVVIQFHHPIGVHDWFYKLIIFKNGKTIMDKQFPVNQYKNIEMIAKKY
jgi:hypothetical protein